MPRIVFSSTVFSNPLANRHRALSVDSMLNLEKSHRVTSATKKADVVEHPLAFLHVGLPVDRPPGNARVPFQMVYRRNRLLYQPHAREIRARSSTVRAGQINRD